MTTYPQGTTVVEYATGPFSNLLGEQLTAEVTVKMLVEETHLVRHSGGGVLVPTVVDVRAPADSETHFRVPAVDQPGWRTPEGAERTGWTYEVRVNILNKYGELRHRWTKYISPLEAQASEVQDLDLVEALSEPIVGETVPARFVRTVNGALPDESGNVSVVGGGGAEVDLSPYVQKSELPGAPGELATQEGVATALSQAGFAEGDHQHEVADVNGLSEALADKASVDHTHPDLATASEMDGALSSKADATHTHPDIEQRIEALEDAPAGGTVSLVESPAGSGLYEIKVV